jgi:methylenetetrahydrofolate--tRNA-(uracil-5-)-methyltransferase
LEKAEFARLGGIHKNNFIQSPLLLDEFLRLKSQPNIMFAGQISGCEGYVESANVGMSAGYFAACLIKDKMPILPPRTTATGAMLAHLRDTTNSENFQPMNINFGIFPTIQGEITANGKFHKFKGVERKEAYCKRALADFNEWKAIADAK